MRPDVLRGTKSLVISNGLHPLLAKAVDGRGVLPQVKLSADEDDGDIWRMMADLWVPLQCIVSSWFEVEPFPTLGLSPREENDSPNRDCDGKDSSYMESAHLGLDVIK